MSFTLLDWSAIVGYLAITLILGLWFRGRSGKSVDDYFVSGRNVNWWLAGTSMVATTFAADTPLYTVKFSWFRSPLPSTSVAVAVTA